MNMDDGGPPKVFIAYAQDSQAHKDDVRGLADLLRSYGVDAEIDQYAEEVRQDWNAWANKHFKESDFILIVASPKMRVFGDGNAPANQNRGVQAEMTVIRDFLQRDRTAWTKKILPVVLPGGTLDGLPDFLGPYSLSHYRVQDLTSEGAEGLLRVITGQPRVVRPPLGPLPQLPPLPQERRTGTTDAQAKWIIGEPGRAIDSHSDRPAINKGASHLTPTAPEESPPDRKWTWTRRKKGEIGIAAAIGAALTTLVLMFSLSGQDTADNGSSGKSSATTAASNQESSEIPSAISTDLPPLITAMERYELNSSSSALASDSNKDKVDLDTGCPGPGTVGAPVDRSHCDKLAADLILNNGSLYTPDRVATIALLAGDTDASQSICNMQLADKSLLRQSIDRDHVIATAEFCIKTDKGNVAAVHVRDVWEWRITIDFEVWRP